MSGFNPLDYESPKPDEPRPPGERGPRLIALAILIASGAVLMNERRFDGPGMILMLVAGGFFVFEYFRR